MGSTITVAERKALADAADRRARRAREQGKAEALAELIDAERERVRVLAEVWELSRNRGLHDYYQGCAAGQYNEATATLAWLERVAQNVD